MGKQSYRAADGPLKDEVYALDVENWEDVPFRMDDGRVLIYKVNTYDSCLNYVGVDLFG